MASTRVGGAPLLNPGTGGVQLRQHNFSAVNRGSHIHFALGRTLIGNLVKDVTAVVLED